MSASGPRAAGGRGGMQTVPPVQRGTNTSLKKGSNVGTVSWLTRQPGPMPNVLVSHPMKCDRPSSVPITPFGSPVEPEV